MGHARGLAGLTSSATAAFASVRLVTPIVIRTDLGQPPLPSLRILARHLVPEPGTLLLLGAGVAVLAAAGRSRRSR